MSRRDDKEDYSRQEQAVAVAKAALVQALTTLAEEALLAAKIVSRKRYPSDVLDDTSTLFRKVKAAEEALDLALLDLHTAQGGHA